MLIENRQMCSRFVLVVMASKSAFAKSIELINWRLDAVYRYYVVSVMIYFDLNVVGTDETFDVVVEVVAVAVDIEN